MAHRLPSRYCDVGCKPTALRRGSGAVTISSLTSFRRSSDFAAKRMSSESDRLCSQKNLRTKAAKCSNPVAFDGLVQSGCLSVATTARRAT